MNGFKVRAVSLSVALLLAFCRAATAQLTFDALIFGSGSAPHSYSHGGIGWTFVPSTDLIVTSIGITATVGVPVRVGFWAGTDRCITNYVAFSWTNTLTYESISPLFLTAGTDYGISFEATNLSSGIVIFDGYSRYGVEGIPVFDTSPYITQFENFVISTNGQWTPSPAPGINGDYLYLGATFRFELLQPPTNAPFKITSVSSRTNGIITIQWDSVTNQLYQVNRSITLSGSNHSVLASNILATPPSNTFSDKAATNSASFYWIEVQQ